MEEMCFLELITSKLVQICETQKMKTTNFFRDFKGVPDEGASSRARAGLAQHQGLIPGVFFKWTSRSEVMAYFQPWYISVPNFLTVISLKLILSESRVLLVFDFSAKGF